MSNAAGDPQVSDSEEDGRRRFELLLLDYEMARDDDRSALGAQATMFGIGVALLAILIPLLTQTCTLNPDKNCTNVPVWIVAAAPMAPFGTIAFLVTIGVIQTIRGYYLRAIEMELQRLVRGDLKNLPVRPASLVHIVTEVISLRRGRVSFRLLIFLVLAAAAAIFGGMTVYIIAQLPPAVALVSGIIYGAAGALMVVEILRASIGGRGLFFDAVRGYLIKRGYFPEMLPQTTARERSLVTYLLLPRPRDTVKWLIVCSAYAYGLVAFHHRPNYGETLRVGLFFLIFEYLIYEARYQWNDIRGLASDIIHPAAKHRLPVGPGGSDVRRNVLISELVILARIVAAIGLAIALGRDIFTQTSTILIVVLVLAIVYEWLRSRTVTPGAEFRVTWVGVATWTLVGCGYALRGEIGLINAGMVAFGWTSALAGIGFAAFGVVFVTMTWLFDASSYSYRNPAAARFNFVPALRRQPQLAALLSFVGGVPGSPVVDGGQLLGAEARVLRSRAKILSPWHIGLLCAGAFAGAFGIDVSVRWSWTTASPVAGQPWAGLAVCCGWVVGFVAVLPPIFARRSMHRWLIVIGTVVVVGGGLWPILHFGVVVALVPWLLFLAVYSWFRDQSWVSLQLGFSPVIKGLRRLVHLVDVVFVGDATASLMAHSRQTSLKIKAGGR
jgi:hypothetical protein